MYILLEIMANVTINALKIYTGGLYHKGFIHAKASQRPLLPIEYSSHTNIAHEIAAIRLIIEGSWKKRGSDQQSRSFYLHTHNTETRWFQFYSSSKCSILGLV